MSKWRLSTTVPSEAVYIHRVTLPSRRTNVSATRKLHETRDRVEGRLFEPGTTNSAVGSMGNNPSMNVKGSQNLAAPVLDALTVFVSDAIVVKCERARAAIGAYFSTTQAA
jgi:hypothetical protein